jgi:hypothetical protein
VTVLPVGTQGGKMKPSKAVEEMSYKNPSYDKSLPIKDRLADFLGKYHIVLNGVVAHDPYQRFEEDGGGMCCQEHQQEIIDFVSNLETRVREEEREKLKEKLKTMRWINDNDGGSMTANMGYNQALDDVVDLLSQEGK